MPNRRLPMRPPSHILGDEALKWVNQCFPDEWTVDVPEPDYGIDLQVEVFEEYAPTGMILYVQVKGVGEPYPSGGAYSHVAEVKWLNYCLTRPGPVLLVIYFKQDRRAMWLWVKDYAHLVLDQVDPTWQQKETVTLHLTKEFGPGSAGEMVGYLYASGWEKIVDQYRRLQESADPRREIDVLGLRLPVLDDEELAYLLSVLPTQVHDRLLRIRDIVEKAIRQQPITRDDGEYVARHLDRLVFWCAQQRAAMSRCQSQLKQLSIAALQYAQDADTLPTEKGWRTELMPYVRNDSLFNCPSAGMDSYAINPRVAGRRLDDLPRLPLFYDAEIVGDAIEPRPTGRHLGNALASMTDGAVQTVTTEHLLLLLEEHVT